MSTITESVNVTVPIRAAYDQWTRFETFPQFMEGVEEIRRLADGTLRWRTRIAGVTREFDARITEQHPDERVAWKSLEGPTHSGVVTFRRLDETTTRVTVQLEIDPEGFVEKAGDRFGALGRRVKGDLRRFKTFVEGRGARTGPRTGARRRRGGRRTPDPGR
ncbi:SRPBCC family protein [Actinomadura livida]|uniref:Putative membrane protein n=1 Tax=Actinomadura livida TaxID=79909 RepID=A0A7W7IDZ1_9ACTN|nr:MULTISPECIES: SRPBCC family protein [Actinomadura]MBB4775154.1 putative membrane protein [Actinomadura catellatispora]